MADELKHSSVLAFIILVSLLLAFAAQNYNVTGAVIVDSTDPVLSLSDMSETSIRKFFDSAREIGSFVSEHGQELTGSSQSVLDIFGIQATTIDRAVVIGRMVWVGLIQSELSLVVFVLLIALVVLVFNRRAHVQVVSSHSTRTLSQPLADIVLLPYAFAAHSILFASRMFHRCTFVFYEMKHAVLPLKPVYKCFTPIHVSPAVEIDTSEIGIRKLRALVRGQESPISEHDQEHAVGSVEMLGISNVLRNLQISDMSLPVLDTSICGETHAIVVEPIKLESSIEQSVELPIDYDAKLAHIEEQLQHLSVGLENHELVDYIRKHLAADRTARDIEESLIAVGWDRELIKHYIEFVDNK